MKQKTTWKVWDGKSVKKTEAQTKAAKRNQTKSPVKKATDQPAQPVESMSFAQFCEALFPDAQFSQAFIDRFSWLQDPETIWKYEQEQEEIMKAQNDVAEYWRGFHDGIEYAKATKFKN